MTIVPVDCLILLIFNKFRLVLFLNNDMLDSIEELSTLKHIFFIYKDQ